MTDTLLRGRLLSFSAQPQDPDDTGAYRYEEDGALLLRDGVILASGTHDEVAPQAGGATVIDHRPHLMMAGFIDPHIHFPQLQVVASWGRQLLDWLNGYVFPEEARFVDPEHAQAMATRFLDLLCAHGTTTAVAYLSLIHI